MPGPLLDPTATDGAPTYGVLTGCGEQRLVTSVLDSLEAVANSQELPKLMLRGCDGQTA